MVNEHLAAEQPPRPARPHTGKFRPDIEGLRALAILPILCNHAGVKGFAGGFVGVDVFFVISGFLITQIIVRDIREGHYSIAQFYRRRILRIFPALFVLLAATTIFAILAMAPSELVSYARSAIATVFFVSNFHFFSDTGYFAPSASARPLLHTWSLAIEEQFYIFWPLIVAFAAPRGRAMLAGVVAVVLIVSFGVAVWMVERDMTAAFYLIPFRAWELGVGGLLALYPERTALPRLVRECLSVGGIAAIAYCVHGYHEPLAFPGLAALPPCLGTAAIIAAGADTIGNRILAFPVLRFFGRISYSLYLWHWPVIVFTALWLFLPATTTTIAGEIVVSILLGWLSYHLVEQALRHRLAPLPTARLLVLAVVAMLVAAAALASLLLLQGLPGRFSPQQLRLDTQLDRDDQAAYRPGSCFVVEAHDRFDPARCLTRQAATKPTLLLVGDSFAAQYWPGFAEQANGYNVLQATMIGCRPMIYPAADKRPCARFFRSILGRWVPGNRPDAVLLAGRWVKGDLPALSRTLTALRAAHQRVILIGTVPRYTATLPRLLFFGTGPDPLARARANYEEQAFAVDTAMRALAAQQSVTYLSPIAMLCPARQCAVYAAPGVPLQFDSGHLTVEASRGMVARYMPDIAATVAAPRP